MKSKVNRTGGTPESEIVKLARNGSLAEVGKRAIKESHRLGLAVTILENGKIYKVYPDGHRELIKTIARTKRTYTTDKIYIK